MNLKRALILGYSHVRKTMDKMNLLLVEDQVDRINDCRDAVKDFQKKHPIKINLVKCQSVKAAYDKIGNSFDAAIIDIKLGNDDEGGDKIIKMIRQVDLRFPVAILTGNPYNEPDFVKGVNFIEIFGRDQMPYANLLDKFYGIYTTGLTKIMGGRGEIEKVMKEMFHDLYRDLSKWQEYGKKDQKKTEKALLRHTLNHLLCLLDDNQEGGCAPEEMYLLSGKKFNDKRISTGMIVTGKKGYDHAGKNFVVMTPACDLVDRNGRNIKAEKILVAEIVKKNSDRSKKRERYYVLQKVDAFEGGLIDFGSLMTIAVKDFYNQFECAKKLRIAPSYIKDAIAKFSSFYARQGQPEINETFPEKSA